MNADKRNENSNSISNNHKICSRCEGKFTEELWCKRCDPFRLTEGWSSGNNDIDKFIKDTIYNINTKFPVFLEWVPFDRFKNIKQIGEGGFAKVYSAIWIDGKSDYDYDYDYYHDYGCWKKLDSKPMKVALKKLKGSQNISTEYLNKLKAHWEFYSKHVEGLRFYGITKDPETGEFMIIMQFANIGNLRCILSSIFNDISWRDKIQLLYNLAWDLKWLHRLGYFHKNFHSGNILQNNLTSYISDFGLYGPSNKQGPEDKIYGVLSYIAPEVLVGKSYTSSSDIYSFGIIMTELSSGRPPFHDRKHDFSLSFAICNGLRPEFGKGTPDIYKKLAYRCTNADPNQRPNINELYNILYFWYNSNNFELYRERERFGYKGKEIKAVFEEANKEIPNISSLYEKDPDAIYTSREFTFNNLPNPVNSSIIITSYLRDEKKNDRLVVKR